MENKSTQNLKIKKGKDDTFLFSTSLIFDENIDKLWLYLRDLSNEVQIVDFLDEFKYIKGNNTWTVGNVCSCYWVGVSHLQLKCKSVNINRTRKKIKWKIKCDIGINYYKTLILYRITQSGKTLVKLNFTRTKKSNNLIDFSQTLTYYTSLQYSMLMKQSQYLQNIKKDIILYESCIINKNHLKIWNIITDLKKLSQITSMSYKNIEYKGQINEVGSFIKYYDENLKKNIFLKIIGYEMSEQKKVSLFRLESIGSYNNNTAKIIEISIIKINNNKAQLSLLHKFSYISSPDYIKQFEIKKREFLKQIIKYIEEN